MLIWYVKRWWAQTNMFRKIVTELAYSPALAGSLGEYIRKVRNERSKRQMGIMFLLLAVVVQLFAVLFPPESANANNPDVFIDGGVQSIDGYLRYYDQNAGNIRDLLSSLGITRADVEAAHQAALPPGAAASMWFIQNNRDLDSLSYSFQTRAGKRDTVYYRPLSQAQPTETYVGKSEKTGEWFAVEKSSGNLITEMKDRTGCSPWFSTATNQENGSIICPPALEASLSARTILKNIATLPRTVHPSDRIVYTLSLTNTGGSPQLIAPAINLEDVLEYARILDNGGGEYNYDSKMFSWTTATLAAGERAERSVTIQLLPVTPSTARGQYITSSYDCTLKASFGNEAVTAADCPPIKRIESLTNSLPVISKKANLIATATLLTITIYLYLRSRQLLSELYIIRHNHTGGI